jgi:hypothetical protein
MVEVHMNSKSYDSRNRRGPSMPEKVRQAQDSGFLEKAQLMKLKLKAMRSGVWFRVLHRIDRALLDLTIKVAGTVRSFILAEKILSVVRKLDSVWENRLVRAAREIGVLMTRKVSLIAQKWGNVEAKEWVFDGRFAKYWAAMSLNERRLFSG